MNAYAVLIPTAQGWMPASIYIAGRNRAEGAAMAASHLPDGAAFRIEEFETDDPHYFEYPIHPLDYNARANATARMVNPGYLSTDQLLLSIEATEADNGGQPF